jgi:lysozyme
MDMNRLLRTLERHEGFREKPYKCTAGRTTIGIGRNLDDNGIRYSEARFLLKNDIEDCVTDLQTLLKNFNELPDKIQEVLINMRFQLGPTRFRRFKNMIQAVRMWDFERMAAEVKDSAVYRDPLTRGRMEDHIYAINHWPENDPI